MTPVKRCHICGKPASIFLTEIIEGKTRDLALCAECARKKGIFDPHKLGLAEQFFPRELGGDIEQFIRNMLEKSLTQDDDAQEEEELEDETPSALPGEVTECPVCHHRLDDFRQTGQLGCPECYHTFASELDLAMPGSNAAADAPDTQETELSPTAKRHRLEKLLQLAVEQEKYEEAAKLRDLLKNTRST